MISPLRDSSSVERNIGLRIAFDGSKYNGWQSQPDVHTVEDTLRSAIDRFEERTAKLIGGSRTDAGVHANGQYANFLSRHLTIPADKYALVLNRYLPPSIVILSSDERPPSFHARYSATRRTYLYTILTSSSAATRAPSPPYCSAGYCAIRQHIPPLAQCNRALAAIIGTHDFRGFAKIDPAIPARSTVRTVYEAAIYPRGHVVQIKISANAFLRNMVRSIIGTVLDDACCKQTYIQKMLYTGDRTLCGETASAHGLCLDWISYD